MKMIVLGFSCLLLCVMALQAQESDISQNDSIKYELILITRGVGIDNHNKESGYYVKINIDKNYKASLICKDFSFWLDKLNSSKNDWSANLFLYYLYSKEATFIKIIEHDRSKWKTVKSNEIKFWQSFFKKRKEGNGCK